MSCASFTSSRCTEFAIEANTALNVGSITLKLSPAIDRYRDSNSSPDGDVKSDLYRSYAPSDPMQIDFCRAQKHIL
jgi:hypothetical protein